MTIEKRIREDIELRIRSGEWKPGHRIPYEHELVASYGCARATVSKALSALAKAGLIDRRRKAGSFVAVPHIRSMVLDIPDIGAAIRARGKAYRYELLNRRILPADRLPETGGEFAPKSRLLELRGMHYADQSPFCHEYRLVGLDTVPAAEQQDFTQQSPGTWLLERVPWTDARHLIRAVGAEVQAAEALAVDAGAPCLSIVRWTWRMGEAVTYVEQLFPGTSFELVAEFVPQSK